ncbi:Hint domain-containing protein [Melittangium boletus]|uniref:Hint domain-containing protein n=1 Tax=Melittangium boletus DSM 14713 TaxID=1294270 RepID=A0A250I8K1_9BACT|nr:Hint domain-containing protein [Melittangium boletus]ATB27540.1 hypothetical protein MEBOL_000983 [Melittangium boletus DSM 14713]
MKSRVQCAVLFSLLALGLVQAGCQGSSNGGNSKQELTQTGLVDGDIKHMTSLALTNGGKLKMDLSDPVQYRFVTARLAASGKTRQNSPQFFSMLDGMVKRHAAVKEGAKVQSGPNTPPRDHIYAKIERPTNETFRVTAFATIEDGADYNFVDIVAWNEAGNVQMSDYGWGEEYSDGRRLIAAASGSVGTTAAVFIKVDSLNIISVAGVEESYYLLESAIIPKAEPGGELIHPRDATGDGLVHLCLDRNYTDCDYPLIGQRVIRFPIKGSIIFATDVERVYTDPAYSFVKVSGQRGGTQQGLSTGIPFGHFVTIDDTDKRKIKWDLAQVDFPSLPFAPNSYVEFILSVKVKLKRGAAGTDAAMVISSLPKGFADTSTTAMPSAKIMRISYSCLAKGTKIQLSSNKTAKIEEIGRQTLVKSDVSGLELPVADVSVGIERIPMVHITDDAGRELLMTKTHPLMTPDKGAVWAGELAVGSKVLTDTGVSTLVKVDQEMYSDNVYNLKLDRGQGKEAAKGSTMFANGFLVGDLAMQKAYEFKNEKDLRADVLLRLPKAWHADYTNSLKVASRR